MEACSEVKDKAWQEYFRDTPVFHLPKDNVVLLAPHPDDETLGAGGLLFDLFQRKSNVTVITVTAGEKAYSNYNGLAEKRRIEQEQAIVELGGSPKSILRIDLPDGEVRESELILENILMEHIDSNTHLFSTWHHDHHCDHEAVGRCAINIAKRTDAKLYFYFFWTWHRHNFSKLTGLSLKKHVLSPNALSAKSKALDCYNSQITNSLGPPVLTPEFLKPAKWNFEVFLPYERR